MYNIISVVSVCLSDDNFRNLDLGSSYLHIGIYPWNMGHVRIWMSSGQGQGHRRKRSKITIPAM